MAQIAGTFSSYDAVGNREDLIEEITMISPTKTPFVSMSGRTTATNTKHEWQTDSLAAAAANAAIEGDETTFPVLTATTRLSNSTQILKKSLIISRTQDKVKKAGRSTDYGHQLEKLMKELARDLERACLQNAAEVTGSDVLAREMKGTTGWITTNVTDKVAAVVTQADIEKASQDMWTEGGNPSIILCGGFNKRTISAMNTGVVKNLNARDKVLSRVVDYFETDFGEPLAIVPDHFIAANNIQILDMDLWNIAVLDELKVEPLAKTGDSRKAHVIMEVTLESLQEKGSAEIINTSTA